MTLTRIFLIGAVLSFAGCVGDSTDEETTTTTSTSPLTTEGMGQMDCVFGCTQ